MADLIESGPVTADDVRESARWFTQVLRTGAQGDFDAPAGNLAWSCWRTGEHVVDDMLAYALQLAGLPRLDYLPLVAADGGDDIARVDRSSGVGGLSETLTASAELLATQVASASPDARAFHPYGLSDGPGFAAMGVVELLVHGYDTAQGLGVDVTPAGRLPIPEGPALRATHRLFVHPPGARPAAALLWCTGRIALPGRSRQTRWTWDSTVR
ncbi:hypothetical protein SAMN05216410_3623 [Sanguibacter gelidistatuariae]|uniref:Mycothiol maleylpyruvate isomerase N-terminal domain-containing protein n=1 Tax=Sanguibacter gelidistatuariae TaxID=1814289 RepID=A0A1G6WER2_9MICO|nr:hypothetical protein [Sanguibacter gelidistatuariae]SDD64342.1 hypothetical protein SAMN05216410_3623 [Sanguibacter gelidistatuariae]